jgi:hypothetical protein
LLLSRYTLLSDLLSRSALLRIPRTNFFTLLQIRDAAASRLCLKLADSDMLLCSISISMPYAKHARSYQSVLLNYCELRMIVVRPGDELMRLSFFSKQIK